MTEKADPAVARTGARDIVHREVFHQVPPKVKYSLTELGQSLDVALAPLDAWGAGHLEVLAASRAG